MATRWYKTVKQSGGDYSSLADAITALAAAYPNMVTSDVYADIEIDGVWTIADTAAVSVNGITTDSTRNINIYTTPTARHPGKNSGNFYRLSVTNLGDYEAALWISADYTIIDGIAITGLTGASNFNHIHGITSVGYGVVIKNNLIYDIIDTSNYAVLVCIYLADSDDNPSDNLVYNNIIQNITTRSSTYVYGIQVQYDRGDLVYNNTIYGMVEPYHSGAIALVGNGSVFVNNLCNGNDTDYSGSFDAISSNNISEDTSSPNVALQEKIVTFISETPGSLDLHLDSTDVNAKDAGADLSGVFTTDIDGQTRSGTWDIGADEYVSPDISLNVYDHR